MVARKRAPRGRDPNVIVIDTRFLPKNRDGKKTLTPLMDEMKHRAALLPVPIDDYEEPLPPASPLDTYFLGVAQKHGIDPFEDEGYEP